MPAQNKINTYGFGPKVIALEQEGLTHQQIADELTKILAGNDTISQPSVTRWLQKHKKEDSKLLNSIRREYREKEFAKDMEILNERIQYNYDICLDGFTVKDTEGKKIFKSNFTVKEKREAEREMREWLKLKAHYCGLDAETGSGDSGTPVDIEKYRLDDRESACNE